MVELFALFSEDDDEEIVVGGWFDASTTAIMDDNNDDGHGCCIPNMTIDTTIEMSGKRNDDFIVFFIVGTSSR